MNSIPDMLEERLPLLDIICQVVNFSERCFRKIQNGAWNLYNCNQCNKEGLLQRRRWCNAIFRRFVYKEEGKAKQSLDINSKNVKDMMVKGISKQSNNSDCGLYLMAYLEKFIQNSHNFIAKLCKSKMNENKLLTHTDTHTVRQLMIDKKLLDQPGLPQEAVAEFNAQNDKNEKK
ncbi:uncharacterized protein CIMG_13225 [Coccidioides immitis RS]|uniref:Ubiquitin-like protease family profile domain-containing protein n=1 Tax=Coccidioides immitis (strain RS) TaxID=246410 RepID=J3K5C8_COCIM|nr:uncharacterized protein CIMG_13225 [Coccidioides immitis RS]EAS29621.3 hypothetical protein CIMG_13225 [Coccidioides immitis RS]